MVTLGMGPNQVKDCLPVLCKSKNQQVKASINDYTNDIILFIGVELLLGYHNFKG
jgi:hypothetical protein